MKSKILGLLALGLLVGPLAAPALAVTVTVAGVNYNVTSQACVYTAPECAALVADQPWWGSLTTASTFAETVGGLLGYPNGWGPLFAYAYDDPSLCLGGSVGLVCTAFLYAGLPTASYGNWVPTINWHYAVAKRVAPVPEPGTLALLGLGLAVLGLSRRRKA